MAARGEKTCSKSQAQKIIIRRRLPGTNLLQPTTPPLPRPGELLSYTMNEKIPLLHENSQIVIGEQTFLIEKKEVIFEVYDEKKDFYKCILNVKLATRSFDGTLAEKDEFFLLID